MPETKTLAYWTITVQKTTCHNQIKFTSYNYLEFYKKLQLFASSCTINTNVYKYTQTYIPIQKLLKILSSLMLGLIKTVYEFRPNEIMALFSLTF